MPSQVFGPPPSSIERLPGNLYGVLSHVKTSSTIKIPAIATKRRQFTLDPVGTVYQAALECLEDLITFAVVHPHLRYVDHCTGTSKSLQNMENTCNRAVTRGAILGCLFEVCQSDGIFASTAIKAFLARPSQDLLPVKNHDARGANNLRKDRQSLLEPVLAIIRAHLEASDSKAIIHSATKIGDVVDAHMQALQNGGVVDHNNDGFEPSVFGSRSAIMKIVDTSDFVANADFSGLLTAIPTPRLTVLACILREALNYERNLPIADEISHRILLGQHPNQNAQVTFAPCQTNPIRKFSEYAKLVQLHLPGHLLTTKEGISNLLSWMGTGQGYNTKPFLKSITRPTRFFSSSMDDLLEIFRPADSSNINLALHAQYSESELRRLPSFIPCYDQRIWGQPNNLLSLHPTVPRSKSVSMHTTPRQKKTLEEKFAPYWQEDIQQKWMDFLGKLGDSNPSISSAPKPSWLATLSFFSKLSIPLFGKGLTVLQTVNNLVYADIVQMPSDLDVAIWIYHNQSLGAYSGLQHLGFSNMITGTSVVYAFRAIYDHLNQFLTADDKEQLGFSPLFLEHALCKVARWSSRLKVKTKSGTPIPTLAQLSSIAEESSIPWQAGNNMSNHMAFPFPTAITREQLLTVLNNLTNLRHKNHV